MGRKECEGVCRSQQRQLGGLVMEYLSNTTCATLPDVWEIVSGVASCLRQIRNSSFVYVDMRHANVRFRRGRFSKLIDNCSPKQDALDMEEVNKCPWLLVQGWTPNVDTYSFRREGTRPRANNRQQT